MAVAIGMVMLTASLALAQTTVTATWDRNADPFTVGYRLFYGTTSGTYQWSVDVGNQTSAPIDLSPGSLYYFAVRAYDASLNYGAPSTEVAVDLRSPGGTAPTAQISASLSGTNTAVVSWQTTNAVAANINGIAVGSSGSASVNISVTTTFTLTATSASGQVATASATVTISAPSAPGAPTGMSSSVSGSNVTLSWEQPTTGGAPSSYLVSVGSSPGRSDIVNGVSVGNVLSVTGALDRGRYYARVRAVNGTGPSADSNETNFRIGRKLRTPGGFEVQWQGTTATFSWSASAADSAEDTPSGYVLEAGSAPGLRDVASINVGNVTTFTTEVPPGRFYVRVRAVNPLGESDPTDDLVVTPPGAPRAPSGLADVGSGSTVDLRWNAPSGGPAPTGYVIEAGSAPGLSNLAVLPVGDVTRFVTTAPPGIYYVRVRAVNGRGPSDASNEIIVRR